jgi:DedD protein
MRDLDQLRERSDETTGRKLGLFALAAVLSVSAAIALMVVEGGSDDGELLREPDVWAQLAGSGDPKAPAPTPSASVELARLSFPTTLIDDDAPSDSTARAAGSEYAALRSKRAALTRNAGLASDIPASTLATDQTARLQRAARHDPLVAQAMPERTSAIAAHGSEGAFTLQVVTYESRDPAERFADALRARGHHAYIAQADVPGRSRYFRVRIGPFTTRREAIEYQQSFEQTERMHTILVTSPGK